LIHHNRCRIVRLVGNDDASGPGIGHGGECGWYEWEQRLLNARLYGIKDARKTGSALEFWNDPTQKCVQHSE
jgi:hypothetical protein